MIPQISEVQCRIGGSLYFSRNDLKSGYWMIPICPADTKTTAFSLVMPFGSTGGHGPFQRHMNSLLRLTPFFWVYLDGMIVFAESESEHAKHIFKVFEAFYDPGLTLRS
ncbi:Transposon Ty3-I Gag-Pol polyprotein [Thelohanellus kitauei]|uniref:Transposon Ty3-I Gag-Pol polyprotein n=1 Tax=Thelohanellus kitauei TaxID=669202 RepID=A0A0C2MMB8_THEKT|nr:Transposon Ty3-I Gag-Pol polyprotein [Thelohanellus kitauei]